MNKLVMLILSIVSLSAIIVSLGPAPTTSAACSTSSKLLTLRPWYDGLEMEGDSCTIKSPTDDASRQKLVWTIALNIVEDLLQVAAYVSFGFIVYGGFIYMTSSGSPDKAAAGQKTLINALVGLVIAMSAVTLVSLVARSALGIS